MRLFRTPFDQLNLAIPVVFLTIALAGYLSGSRSLWQYQDYLKYVQDIIFFNGLHVCLTFIFLGTTVSGREAVSLFIKNAGYFGIAQFLMILGPGRRMSGSVLNARETLLLLRLLWVSMFFLSALNKLRFSGWDWAADNFVHDYLLANQITRAGTLAGRPFAEFAHVLIAQPIATLAIGYFVLLFELLYPLILIKRLKIPILVGTLFFQLATFTLLGVNFLFYVPLLPIWLKETPSK